MRYVEVSLELHRFKKNYFRRSKISLKRKVLGIDLLTKYNQYFTDGKVKEFKTFFPHLYWPYI